MHCLKGQGALWGGEGCIAGRRGMHCGEERDALRGGEGGIAGRRGMHCLKGVQSNAGRDGRQSALGRGKELSAVHLRRHNGR